MPLINGTSRRQMQIFAVEQLIGTENPVRVIDAFVETLAMDELDFVLKGGSREGRPAYSAQVLLKLYLYGYLNRIRSSRQLEQACCRNVELWWLLNYQQPGYKTIADFRKGHAASLKGVFRKFNAQCQEWELFGRELIAVDGSKFRAQNSKKNNYNAAKIQRQGKAIERSEYEEYVQANAVRVKAEREKYRRRQAIVEHPFGTLKRSWGYTYTLLKGKEKVSGEFALIFTCYNLRRAMSILGVKALLERLERLFWGFLQLRAAGVRLSALKNGLLYSTPGCSRAA